MDVSLGSDGGCTAFAWAQAIWPQIGACCALHDLGGSDGSLLDCLQGALPHWAWPLVGFSVALMILVRPAYNFMQRQGWVK